MPIEYVIDEQRRVLEIVFLGAVSRDEIASIREQIERENRAALAYDSIVDLRQGSMRLTTTELRDVARGARENAWPLSRCAFVAPHDPAYLDLKLFELWSLRGPREYRVFRSLGDACAWLGLDRAGLCLEEIAKS
jgi:hypothetical protein